MTNYQLYRSNVLLGGQMKYDLILSSKSGELYISDFHITPISQNVPYSKLVDDNLLNGTHQENIKYFYSDTADSFYKTFTNQTLESLQPANKDYNGELYDSTYEMGCKRMSYQLYSKQFEFFCPVWLEKLDDIKKLTFDIQIKPSTKSTKPLFTDVLKFDSGDSNICAYFNEYLKTIKLNDGCDWVLNIDSNNNYVHGLNVKTGNLSDINVFELYDSLTYRERPLLEFNNLIINELNRNDLIAVQLFNFNLCFNLEDILNPFVYKELCDKPLYINVVVKVDGKELGIYDIFSNHEYIERDLIYTPTVELKDNELIIQKESSDINVLDYLKDYNNIDLIDKNKIVQNTCHWSYSNNDKISFNMYNGFSAVYKSGESTYISIPYYNGETANISVNSKENDSLQKWCNDCKIEYTQDSVNVLIEKMFIPIFNNENKWDDLFSTFSSDCIVKNINYKYIGANPQDTISPIKVLFAKYDDIYKDQNGDLVSKGLIKEVTNVVSKYHDWTIVNISIPAGIIPDGDGKYITVLYTINDDPNGRKIIFFVSEDQSDIIKYGNFIKFCNSINNNGLGVFGSFIKIINSPDFSKNRIICFRNGLVSKVAPGPSLGVKETNYYKSKNIRTTLIRNFGKIKPFFIKDTDKHKNNKYVKLRYDDNDLIYPQYIKTEYPPKYPSVKYFYISNDGHVKYQDYSNDENCLEFHNYKTNKVVELIPELYFEFEYDSENYLNVDEEYNENSNKKPVEYYIKEHIKNTYDYLIGDNDSFLNYIVNLYLTDYTYIDTITSNNETNKLLYKIKIKLK